jgi:carbonic anhydrase
MESHDSCCQMSRRRLIGMSGAALAGLAAASVVGLGSSAHADSLSKKQRDAMSPDEVIAAMLAGNERFVSGQQKPRDFLAEQRASAAGQFPAAIALSCVDSRAPVEVVAISASATPSTPALPAISSTRIFSAAWSSPVPRPARSWLR